MSVVTYIAADGDAKEIGDLYAQAKASLVDSVKHQIECGRRLALKKQALGHGNWLPWLEEQADVLGFGERSARMLIMAANRKLASDIDSGLEPEEALQISRQTWGHSAPANYSSESVEWYTPQVYLDAVRDVLGGVINLDPASCELANAAVRAEQFFGIDDDGLNREWFGTVFLNPPYGIDGGESVAGMFCRKLVSEYTDGRVDAAVLLVNSVHSQRWQAPLYRFPICLVDHRIQFVSGDGARNENPTFQNIFVYLGNDLAAFRDVFREFGYVVRPVDDAGGM